MNKKNKSLYPLGESYPLTQVDDARSTKDIIMLESAVLFAKHGYDAISMRDIAHTIGLKAGSLYSHFESKDALRDAILDHTLDLYMLYFQRLEATRPQMTGFKETLDSMFLELIEVVDIFTYYCFSWVQSYQFSNEKAAGIFNDTFLKYSIGYVKGRFDECVQKNWCKPFATETVATFFMHSVLIGIEVRLHENLGRETAYDVTEMYASLKQFILDAVLGQAHSA